MATSTPAPAPEVKAAGRAPSAGGVGIEELERKETRLHERQVVALVEQARRLTKLRGKDDHRITENTLIRLGVDLVPQQAADLHGVTEAELASPPRWWARGNPVPTISGDPGDRRRSPH